MDVGQHPSGKQSKVSVTSNCFSVCYPDYHIDQSYGSEIGHIILLILCKVARRVTPVVSPFGLSLQAAQVTYRRSCAGHSGAFLACKPHEILHSHRCTHKSCQLINFHPTSRPP